MGQLWTTMIATGAAYAGARSNVHDEPLRVVVITDWHTNPHYNRSLSPRCRCTQWPGQALESACVLATPASEYGQYGCDSSPALSTSSLLAAAASTPAPDVVLVLGDLVTHNSPDDAFTQSTFHLMSQQIADAFPNRPFACQTPLGNNDVYPNYGINNSDSKFYAPQAATAQQFCGMTDAETSTFIETGYYSRQLRELDRLLVLNTNVYASQNAIEKAKAKAKAEQARRGVQPMDSLGGGGDGDGQSHDYLSARQLSSIEPDPLGQFAWIREQLEWANANGGRIYIAGHIPPTLDSFTRVQQWQQAYADQYWALIAAYPTVLGFHLFGHLHSGEVRALESVDPGVQAAPALQILNSVSPIYASNPAFYTMAVQTGTRQSNLTLHSFDLEALAPGKAPTYVPVPQRPLDQDEGLVASNRGYLNLFAAFLEPELNASSTAQYEAFFNQYKGGHHGQKLACEHVEATFQECATCTAGCRVAFVCLQAHGIKEDEYQACVATHGRRVDRPATLITSKRYGEELLAGL